MLLWLVVDIFKVWQTIELQCRRRANRQEPRWSGGRIYQWRSAGNLLPWDRGLHHLSRSDHHCHEEPLHQALLHWQQAYCLQDWYRQIQQCLWHQRQQRYGRSERLCRPHDADRKAAWGVLQTARHTAGSADDEGCNCSSRFTSKNIVYIGKEKRLKAMLESIKDDKNNHEYSGSFSRDGNGVNAVFPINIAK